MLLISFLAILRLTGRGQKGTCRADLGMLVTGVIHGRNRALAVTGWSVRPRGLAAKSS